MGGFRTAELQLLHHDSQFKPHNTVGKLSPSRLLRRKHILLDSKKEGRQRQKRGRGRERWRVKKEPLPFLKLASIHMTDGGRTGGRAGTQAPPHSHHAQSRELTAPSARGKERQGREQQLHILLKLPLKMTRHFTGKVTTIWALGAGDEAESGGSRLWSPPLSV